MGTHLTPSGPCELGFFVTDRAPHVARVLWVLWRVPHGLAAQRRHRTAVGTDAVHKLGLAACTDAVAHVAQPVGVHWHRSATGSTHAACGERHLPLRLLGSGSHCVLPLPRFGVVLGLGEVQRIPLRLVVKVPPGVARRGQLVALELFRAAVGAHKAAHYQRRALTQRYGSHVRHTGTVPRDGGHRMVDVQARMRCKNASFSLSEKSDSTRGMPLSPARLLASEPVPRVEL